MIKLRAFFLTLVCVLGAAWPVHAPIAAAGSHAGLATCATQNIECNILLQSTKTVAVVTATADASMGRELSLTDVYVSGVSGGTFNYNDAVSNNSGAMGTVITYNSSQNIVVISLVSPYTNLPGATQTITDTVTGATATITSAKQKVDVAGIQEGWSSFELNEGQIVSPPLTTALGLAKSLNKKLSIHVFAGASTSNPTYLPTATTYTVTVQNGGQYFPGFCPTATVSTPTGTNPVQMVVTPECVNGTIGSNVYAQVYALMVSVPGQGYDDVGAPATITFNNPVGETFLTASATISDPCPDSIQTVTSAGPDYTGTLNTRFAKYAGTTPSSSSMVVYPNDCIYINKLLEMQRTLYNWLNIQGYLPYIYDIDAPPVAEANIRGCGADSSSPTGYTFWGSGTSNTVPYKENYSDTATAASWTTIYTALDQTWPASIIHIASEPAGPAVCGMNLNPTWYKGWILPLNTTYPGQNAAFGADVNINGSGRLTGDTSLYSSGLAYDGQFLCQSTPVYSDTMTTVTGTFQGNESAMVSAVNVGRIINYNSSTSKLSFSLNTPYIPPSQGAVVTGSISGATGTISISALSTSCGALKGRPPQNLLASICAAYGQGPGLGYLEIYAVDVLSEDPIIQEELDVAKEPYGLSYMSC